MNVSPGFGLFEGVFPGMSGGGSAPEGVPPHALPLGHDAPCFDDPVGSLRPPTHGRVVGQDLKESF